MDLPTGVLRILPGLQTRCFSESQQVEPSNACIETADDQHSTELNCINTGNIAHLHSIARHEETWEGHYEQRGGGPKRKTWSDQGRWPLPS
eukprot:1665419-Amphidinium_carterae.1